MRALIDADLLLWECSFSGQAKDEETGEVIVLDFERAREAFDQKVREIEEAVEADEESHLYFTADERLVKLINKERKRSGEELLQFIPNFRFDIAKSKPYKDRKTPRPAHYYNLRAYAWNNYKSFTVPGLEADDLLAMYQDTSNFTTVICSRDKDLRQVPGMQYSWECGNQASWGPELVDHLGYLKQKACGGVFGTGMKFFYAQLITGDSVDTIPGLPRGGPKLAYKLLADCESEEELYAQVAGAYQSKLGEGWQDYLKEQMALLWMVREVDNTGKPVPYSPPAGVLIDA